MGKFVILGKGECRHCADAESLLVKHNIGYIFYDISYYPDLGAYLTSCGLTTVPQIYYNGDRIGGFCELPRFLRVIGVIK